MKAIVDCNNFYCSCERLFRPGLRNKPVVVLSNNDGCVIARTDEAKLLGIGMAAPYYLHRTVIEKNGVSVFSSNYALYGDLSHRVMDTIAGIVGRNRMEIYSVDEAFLDLDENDPAVLLQIGHRIRERVEQWTGIQVSVGMAASKLLAKVANRLSKKNKQVTRGVMLLDSEDKILSALEQTPVEDLWGVGRRYALKLKEQWGVQSALQLRNLPDAWARTHLGGVVGLRLLRELRGEPALELKDPLEKKKMISTTRMFGRPAENLADLQEAVATYTARAAEKLRRQHSAAGALEVFVVTNPSEKGAYQYRPHTEKRHCILPSPTALTHELIRQAVPMVTELFCPGSRYLKTGVILSELVPENSLQGSLFHPTGNERAGNLMEAIDNINHGMGCDLVKFLSTGLEKRWKMKQELRSGRYTTRWEELFTVR